MKILRLELRAFGPFTERVLSFAAGGPTGLHVVYGCNEAGKSSTLRALKAWLFGFPERTTDNFLHANEQLLVGGAIAGADGGEFVFYRRKRRKADLLDAQGDPLPAELLAQRLPVAEQALFDSLYGLSHEDLVRGGEAILAQKGEVGQALFSAGAGTASLRRFQLSLETEAEALFKARGSKQEINLALARHRELQKTVRETSLPAREWHELQAALDRAEETLKSLEKKRAENDRQMRRQERLRQLLPQIALRATLRAEIEAFGEVVLLPEDFAARRQEVERELHALRRRHEDRATGLRRTREQLAALAPQQPVLEMGEEIEALHRRLGEYQKGQNDLPRLDGLRIGCKSEAARSLGLIRPDLALEQAEALRPVLGRKRLITALVGERTTLRLRLEQSGQQLAALRRELARIREKLALLPAPLSREELRQAVRRARRAGDIDGDLRTREQELEREQSACRQELAAIGFRQEEAAAIPALPLPLEQTVHRHQELFLAAAREEMELKEAFRQAEEKLAATAASLQALARGGEIPTEEELLAARARRQEGWELVLRQWLRGEELAGEIRAYHPELPLAEAYAGVVAQADSLADRLRREADRVHAFAALRAEEQALGERLRSLAAAREEQQRNRLLMEKQWQDLWRPLDISPLPPGEMLAWLGEFAGIRLRARKIMELGEELHALRQQRAELRAVLIGELRKAGREEAEEGGELEPLLLQGETLAAGLESAALTGAQLEERKEALLNEENSVLLARQEVAEKLEHWQAGWDEMLGGLEPLRGVLPEEVEDLLENLQNCFGRLKEAAELRARMEGIRRDAEAFAKNLASVAEKIAPGSGGLPAAQVVARLMSTLGRAREEDSLRRSSLAAMAEMEKEQEQTGADLKEQEERLARLCALAGGRTPEELDEAERRSAEYRSLRQQLAATERLLLEGAGGLSLEELEIQAAAVNPDEVPATVARLVRENEEELAPEIRRLQEETITLRNRLRAMDGNARAAESLEENARTLARIRRLAERYLVLRLAARILRNETERFRAANQAPILRLAAACFRDLTLGSFAGLRTDENEQGEPVLVGLRPDGGRVGVEQMSSGSRDQLYLALRLASLQWRLERHEPMPFIVDDVLVNFDDERSLATLRALAAMGEKTQVILFTHHGRVRDEALGLGDHGVHVHLLGCEGKK